MNHRTRSPSTTAIQRDIELPRRRRGAAAGDAIRLFDERDGEPRRERDVFRLDDVPGGNASPCPVAEHEHASRLVDVVEMRVRGAVVRFERRGWSPAHRRSSGT